MYCQNLDSLENFTVNSHSLLITVNTLITANPSFKFDRYVVMTDTRHWSVCVSHQSIPFWCWAGWQGMSCWWACLAGTYPGYRTCPWGWQARGSEETQQRHWARITHCKAPSNFVFERCCINKGDYYHESVSKDERNALLSTSKAH